MCDVIWKGRPNSISLMHPIGVLTRLIPASIGITVVMWIVVSVLQMQSDHGSVESIIVDGLMCILLLPLFAPSVFIILEPLRRKLFWRMLNYEITGSSLRIVMRICNYRKVFENQLTKLELCPFVIFLEVIQSTLENCPDGIALSGRTVDFVKTLSFQV